MSTIEHTAADEMFLGLFTTALEGGIGYWSECSSYHWSFDDGSGGYISDYWHFKARIVNCVFEDVERFGDEYHIDRRVISRGYRLASTTWRDKLCWSTEPPPLVIGPETDWDYDAGDADMIVQLGLFDDVVYS